jgi:hypothetical protein
MKRTEQAIAQAMESLKVLLKDDLTARELERVEAMLKLIAKVSVMEVQESINNTIKNL